MQFHQQSIFYLVVYICLQTLVAETLVLAKTHGYVEKIEHELEEELQRENTEPPNEALAK